MTERLTRRICQPGAGATLNPNLTRIEWSKIMSDSKNTLAAFGLFLALLAFAPGVSRAQGGKSPSDVNVVNTPNVKVVNTPTVNIGNTPNVNVVGTPTVRLGNTTANPLPVRDVDNPARQPFTDQLRLISGNDRTITVPAGKRLVIEYVSGRAVINASRKFKEIALLCTALTSEGLFNITHVFTPVFAVTEGNPGGLQVDFYSISQQTRLYVEPGGTVKLIADQTPSEDSQAQIVINISGYLVDVQ